MTSGHTHHAACNHGRVVKSDCGENEEVLALILIKTGQQFSTNFRLARFLVSSTNNLFTHHPNSDPAKMEEDVEMNANEYFGQYRIVDEAEMSFRCHAKDSADASAWLGGFGWYVGHWLFHWRSHISIRI